MLIPYESPLQSVAFVYSNIVFFGIIFSWGIYVQRSILSAKIRRLMLSVVFFMLMYILVGSAKHGVFLDKGYYCLHIFLLITLQERQVPKALKIQA